MAYSRFAVYYVPPDGPLASFGAAWLGWDLGRGCRVSQYDVPGLESITEAPRKYGLHGTLKAPFRIAEGRSVLELEKATAQLAAALAPARCGGLEVATLGRFLALLPQGDLSGLQRVAGACVRLLDDFRAPASEAELLRRRKARLNARQEAFLAEWGYPYVMEEFRFHLTLTGRIDKSALPAWSKTLMRHVPTLPSPFVMDQIALCGERPDGQFELLHRYPLTG
ncbi:DUF1045 domain-containing protein [Cognatishimia sp. F0-27]|uniref:DUF1045 domain-containing protein n=1 Tax=Cognatishimia sp. F0-27 TaxID=2816855 RepID=UPI001D0CB345|nr:DUF1045 domain-containing protein [Cognatishimia sp. F0-27]MCC1491340.1 DUF1045 domain-containing protein [Cognatishimia sp. F0-27]